MDAALRASCIDSLAANSRDGKFITAGYWQYRSVWVRDICFSAEDLVRVGFKSQVEEIVKLYLLRLDANGIGPKGFDSFNFEWRQVKACVRRALCLARTRDPLDKRRLKPFYMDSASGREAFDSNALVIIAARACKMPLTDRQVRDMLKYYARRTHPQTGLMMQHAYSDWQDSRRRRGATFIMNLLVWRALSITARTHPHIVSKTQVDEFELVVHRSFYHGGLYVSRHGVPTHGLDGNVMALRWKFGPHEHKNLYAVLRTSELWKRSAVTWPLEGKAEVHMGLRLFGLSAYHSDVRWSWIMGAQAQLAREYGDHKVFMELVTRLAEVARAEGHMPETFMPGVGGRLQPWRTWVYQSEGPFSWGAAFCASAVQWDD